MSNEPDYSPEEVRLARSKGYTGHAIAALVLGFFLWIPGFIATIMFRKEAKRTERIAGESLPGVGCLTVMFWYYLITFALGGILLVVIIGAVASSS